MLIFKPISFSFNRWYFLYRILIVFYLISEVIQFLSHLLNKKNTGGNQHVLTCLDCACQIKLIDDTTPNVFPIQDGMH